MAKETKEKILMAAMDLYALHGLDKVSVRDVTKKAGVNLSSLSYHFTDKNGLMKTVIEKCVENICQSRLSLLKKAHLDSNNKPSLRQVIEAFVAPVFIPEIHQTSPKLIGAIIAKTLTQDPDNNLYTHSILVKTINLFLDCLSKLYPHAEREQLRKFLQVSSSSSVSYRAFSYNQESPSGIDSSLSRQTKELNQLVDFISGGFKSTVAIEEQACS